MVTRTLSTDYGVGLRLVPPPEFSRTLGVSRIVRKATTPRDCLDSLVFPRFSGFLDFPLFWLPGWCFPLFWLPGGCFPVSVTLHCDPRGVVFYHLAAVATQPAPDSVVNKTTAEHPLLLTFRATANPSVFHDFPLF